MLIGTLGVRLILWVGPTVPTPPASSVLDAVARVEVTSDAAEGDGFQITFTLGRDLTDWSLLSGGVVEPFTRVWIGLLLGAVPQVLIDGVITHHQLAPSNEPGRSTLTVTGKDVSAMLDLEEKSECYPNQPDSVIVTTLLASYATYGLVPSVTPTTDVPIETDRVPRQAETDFKFIRRMAERNGFVFYVEPVTFGVNNAWFGPEVRTGVPQSALTMNMGADSNLDSLSFQQDALAPVATAGTFVEPTTKVALPIPSLPSLRVPPLVATPTPAKRTVLLRGTAQQNVAQAALSTLAARMGAPEAVSAEGEVDVVRYGSVLRARQLVGVRGAGASYDGNYFVRRVSHVVERSRVTTRFSLRREGTGALLPVVVP